MRLLLLIVLCAFLARTAAEGAQRREPSKRDRAVAVYAARPEYPYEARRAGITGTGVVIMQVDKATGKVTSCRMEPSTGSVILDAAALNAFRQWRFKPGTIAQVRVPITFTVGGQVVTEYRVKQKPMDDALSAFLGKGAIAKGPIPAYPRSVPWTTRQGKGVYELTVRKDGTISSVKILKRSGDDIFDRTAVETLRKWRLRRGPLIIELPLSFRLSPSNYSVEIPKE